MLSESDNILRVIRVGYYPPCDQSRITSSVWIVREHPPWIVREKTVFDISLYHQYLILPWASDSSSGIRLRLENLSLIWLFFFIRSLPDLDNNSHFIGKIFALNKTHFSPNIPSFILLTLPLTVKLLYPIYIITMFLITMFPDFSDTVFSLI